MPSESNLRPTHSQSDFYLLPGLIYCDICTPFLGLVSMGEGSPMKLLTGRFCCPFTYKLLLKWRLFYIRKKMRSSHSSMPCQRHNNVQIEVKILAVNTQLKQLRKESLKKIQAWTRFEPMTSAMPVQCSTNWAIKPTGSWSYCEFIIYPSRMNN